MKLMPTIIAALYDHFFKMKERGRKVVPWVQTVFVCALEANFLTFMIGKNILQVSGVDMFGHVSEGVFIFFFMLVGCGYFYIVKRVYFDTEKFIGYYETFLQFSKRKRVTYKVLAIGLSIAIPLLLFWKIWYDAK